jgi:hypothetical protein
VISNDQRTASIEDFLHIVGVNGTGVEAFTAMSLMPFKVTFGDSVFQLQFSFHNFLEEKIKYCKFMDTFERTSERRKPCHNMIKSEEETEYIP